MLGELPPQDELDREFNLVGLAHRVRSLAHDGGKMQSGAGGASTPSMLDWTDEQWKAIRPKKK